MKASQTSICLFVSLFTSLLSSSEVTSESDSRHQLTNSDEHADVHGAKLEFSDGQFPAEENGYQCE